MATFVTNINTTENFLLLVLPHYDEAQLTLINLLCLPQLFFFLYYLASCIRSYPHNSITSICNEWGTLLFGCSPFTLSAMLWHHLFFFHTLPHTWYLLGWPVVKGAFFFTQKAFG